MSDIENTWEPTEEEDRIVEYPQPERTEAEDDGLYMFTRFLVGAIVLGGDELINRIRTFQRELDEKQIVQYRAGYSDDETGLDTLRYLMIGMLMRGQKRVSRGVKSGVDMSYRVSARMLNAIDIITDNPLMRPMRRRVDGIIANLQKEGQALVREGRYEEESGRYLTRETVSVIIDDLLDYMADNPELAELIRAQIGQQSVGLANVVADNTRRGTTVGDDLVEGIVRRILRLTPRQELSESPFAGKTQTMYIGEWEEDLLEGTDE